LGEWFNTEAASLIFSRSFIRAANGKLYGMTVSGGLNNMGEIFEYDRENKLCTTKFIFDGTNGKYPKGSLIQATNGKLYGMTYEGGTNNFGVMFEYDITNDTVIKKADIISDLHGAHPSGSLLQASNGKMYATTYLGACSSGAIIEYDPLSDTLVRIICDGYPTGNLIEIEAICVETADTITEVTCDNYTSPSGRYTWTTSGTYKDTIPNAEGCDSVITINLTVNIVDVSVTQDGITLTAGEAEPFISGWIAITDMNPSVVIPARFLLPQ
jgi:uncharacterized repeat protein (TIGR03803 family)